MSRPRATLRVQKIVWAIDAFHEAPKTQIRALQAFLKLNGRAPVTIQPVAVVQPGIFDPHSGTFPKQWKELATAALENLFDATDELAVRGLAVARLLQVKGHGTSEAVTALVAYAIEHGASLIVTSSQSRTGFDRVALGSFAETLVLLSPIPVLVVNPKVRTHQKLATLVFPTDFSPASKKGYERLLPYARRYGVGVLLFHHVPLPLANTGGEFLLPKVSKESLQARKNAALKTGAAWVRLADAQRVRAKVHVDAGGGHVREAILKVARRLGKNSLVAMTSQSGRWKAALLGSVARQVIRGAPCPVLVVHAEQPTLVKEFLREVREAAWAYSAHPVMS